MGGGWQIAANPAIGFDHEQESGDQLTLPLGIGLAKTAILKGLPIYRYLYLVPPGSG